MAGPEGRQVVGALPEADQLHGYAEGKLDSTAKGGIMIAVQRVGKLGW